MSQPNAITPFDTYVNTLDRLRTSLQADLERLGAALLPIPDDFEARFRELVNCITVLRNEVAEFAVRAGLAFPGWTDRESLEVALSQLVDASAQREGARRRERLRLVGGQLQAGEFVHRLPAKLAR